MKTFWALAYALTIGACVMIVIDDVYRARKASEEALEIALCIHRDLEHFADVADEKFDDLNGTINALLTPVETAAPADNVG